MGAFTFWYGVYTHLGLLSENVKQTDGGRQTDREAGRQAGRHAGSVLYKLSILTEQSIQ